MTLDDIDFGKIKNLDPHEKRVTADSLYNHLYFTLINDCSFNESYSRAFNNLDMKSQKKYVRDAIRVIGSVPGFESHAEKLQVVAAKCNLLQSADILSFDARPSSLDEAVGK